MIRRGAIAIALLALAGIFANQARAGQDRVVATVGARSITEQEVDSKLKSQLTSIESQLYELRRHAIESIADDYLIEQAAKRAGLSVDAFLKREVDDKVPPPSDAETQKFYDDHKSQITQPYGKVKPMLTSIVKRRAADRRRSELLESLRATEPVKIALKAPRFQIASQGHPELGPRDAAVTIVEFGDFQCPFCKKSEDALKEIRARYGDKVRLVYMDFPLQFHANALPAAIASHCAGEQGEFWQYHDQLFTEQSKLTAPELKAAAAKLNLDSQKFGTCLDQRKYESAVRRDIAQGQSVGVNGTPAFFINGRELSGAQPASEFEQMIDEELATASDRMAKARP